MSALHNNSGDPGLAILDHALPDKLSGFFLGWLVALNCMFLSPLHATEASDEESTNRETHGYIAAGIGNQSDDSLWFGRYTGLSEAGVFLTGELDITSTSENGSRTQLVGRRLGLDSQSILLEQGTQGRYKLKLRHDEIPYYQYDTAVTPYVDTGDNTLVLPGSLRDPRAYKPVELGTRRKRNSAELLFIPLENWKTGLTFRQDKRNGALQTGGGLGYSTRNMAMAMIPGPIDYTTDLIDAKLAYAKDKGNIELAYHLSMFRNNNQSLTWENPYPGSSGNAGQLGQLALEPDNDFQQLMLSGGYQLPRNSYLSAVLSSGLMTQEQEYLPYTTNPEIAVTALPRDSLDGEVKQNIAQFKLSSRPVQDWQFNASYRYHDHDNNTPQAAYIFPMADSLPPGKTGKDEEELTAINQPLSYTRQTTRLNAKYRFSRAASLQMGYDIKNTERENSEVDKTDEHNLWGKLKWKQRDNRLDGWLKLGHASRDGSGYHPTTDYLNLYIDNPLLRKYYLADMERDELRIHLNYLHNEYLNFAANFAYSQDDYTDSLVGLTSAHNHSATVEATYTPSDRITTYAYYTRDLIESEQTGREYPPAATGSFAERNYPDWSASVDDTMDNFGIGALWREALPKVDMGADYVYAKSQGKTDLVLPEATLFPELNTRLHSLKLYARYRHTDSLSFRLSYWHDQYDSQDWALDGVNPTSAGSPTSLFMVNNSPEYDVNIVMLSMRYSF